MRLIPVVYVTFVSRGIKIFQGCYSCHMLFLMVGPFTGIIIFIITRWSAYANQITFEFISARKKEARCLISHCCCISVTLFSIYIKPTE